MIQWLRSDIYTKFLANKLTANLEDSKDFVTCTTNMMGNQPTSEGATKWARPRIHAESDHFEHLLQTDTL
jgi:hypothetical protein